MKRPHYIMTSPNTGYIPVLSIPFKSAMNPEWEAANQAGYEWAIKMGLLHSEEAQSRFKLAVFGNLTGRAYPYASYEALTLANQYSIWLFMHDDHCDEAQIGEQPDRLKAYHRHIIDVIKHGDPMAEDSPLIRSLYILLRIARKLGGKDLMERLWRHTLEYFEGCHWEATNRQAKRTPGVEEYILGRDKSSAVFICLDLGELAYETYTLPAYIRNSDEFWRASVICNRVVSWANDIFSFQKEYQQGDLHNLVMIIKEEHNLTVKEAMDEVAQMVHDKLALYKDVETRLLAMAPNQRTRNRVQQYCRLLRDWMRGNLDWSYETARYKQERATAQAASSNYLENIL